jgi:hypothetical protein
MTARFTATTRRFAAVGAVALWAVPSAAFASSGAVDLISPETLAVYARTDIAVVGGERSFEEGGFGKLASGGGRPAAGGDARITPNAAAGLVWQPRLGWSLSGTVVAEAQAGPHPVAGLSAGWLAWKPLSDGALSVSARAGLFWPPISLEHTGPEWSVEDTITPSAVNSWIAEEVKVVGLEGTARLRLGGHTISATAALFDYNDTAGALLTLRGWALHDRSALVGRSVPLPPLNDFITYVQPL